MLALSFTDPVAGVKVEESGDTAGEGSATTAAVPAALPLATGVVERGEIVAVPSAAQRERLCSEGELQALGGQGTSAFADSDA